MKLLLDTHAFIWWDSNPTALTATVRALLNDPANTILLSVASIWEMQIKIQTGKLTSAHPLATTVADHQKQNHTQVLTIEASHEYALDSLVLHHRDPFDRLLVAQAIIEQATLISKDPLLAQYPVTVVW